MKMKPNINTLVLGGATLLALTCPRLHAAVTWNEIQFSGFLSQGFVYTTDNDYPTVKSSSGDFNLREYAVNATHRFGSQWRVGAQVFGQKLGDYGNDQPVLDWAVVDYNVRQEFGLRVGRVKMPRGLYNEALDLDMARVQLFMPESVYDPRLRDFNASFDGIMAYGSIQAGSAGSFDYKVFYGDIPVKSDSGANDYFNQDLIMPNFGIGMDSAVGGSLFWNTPVEGLRIGYSYSQFKNLQTLRSNDGTELRKHTKSAANYPRHLASAEFIRGDWTFATEYGHEKGDYVVKFIHLPLRFTPHSSMTYYYVSASRRLNRSVELGVYFDSYREENTISTGSLPTKKQDDHAISIRFDATEHLILKLEGHYFDGAGKVFDSAAHPQPPSTLDQSWSMIAAKATVFF